jgi:F5/8 type C domain
VQRCVSTSADFQLPVLTQLLFGAAKNCATTATPFIAASCASIILRLMALVAHRWFQLRAAPLGVVLLSCSACSTAEDSPLGSPSYLPPDAVADASDAMSGDVGQAASGGADAGNFSVPGGGAAGLGGAGLGGAGLGGVGLGGAGSGGSADASSMCAAHAISAKATWKVTASSSGATTPLTDLYDDNLTNHWSTGKAQAGNEWIEVDFGVDVTLTKVTLVLGTSTSDYPRRYEVRFSDTPMSTGPALLTGAGMTAMDTEMVFAMPLTGRYLRISQTGTSTKNFWSAAEIQTQCQG